MSHGCMKRAGNAIQEKQPAAGFMVWRPVDAANAPPPPSGASLILTHIINDYCYQGVLGCLPTYLLDQFVLQLFGHRLGGRQSSRYLHRPLVQVLPVPVGGPQRAGEHGAEDGEDTTHHRRATSHFHLRDNSARRGRRGKKKTEILVAFIGQVRSEQR